MLPFLVATTFAAFAASLALILSGGASPAAAAHVALAAGIMPLIFGAMMHFVPVLTRSGTPAPALRWLPLAFLAAGILAAAAFIRPSHFDALIHAGAGVAFVAALAMAAWIARRGRAALGAPHPGLYWYLAAALCLALALAAALAMPAFPAQRAALRLFHLHLNTLGFVGLTALGTLTVLLPTAVGQPDPDAAGRLRRDLPLAVAGVLLTAAGAAWWPPLAYAGLVLLFLPIALLGTAWVVRFPRAMLRAHGAAPSLALALAGLMALLVLSALHAQRRLAGGDAVFGFLLAFLLPLVSGAASQLLPTWLAPGVQTDWHRAARETLGRFAVLRGLTFVAAGLTVALGQPAAGWLAAAALAAFAIQVLRVFLRR
ncbi:MAG: hypothetical protein HZC23_05325 [Rhodocyclales bacterium]|nr:hypothetical protein [Rhodocyclales bacterium]